MRQLKLFKRKMAPRGTRSRALCHPDRANNGYGFCKSCYNKHRYRYDGGKTKDAMQAYTTSRPDMRKAIWRKHAYGLSMEECQTIYERQGRKCGICRESGTLFSLNIDHDHVTGFVRGMLCGLCNRALGQFRDRLDLVTKAQAYMEVWEHHGHLDPIGKKKREASKKPRFRTAVVN